LLILALQKSSTQFRAVRPYRTVISCAAMQPLAMNFPLDSSFSATADVQNHQSGLELEKDGGF